MFKNHRRMETLFSVSNRSCFLSCWYVFMSSWMLSSSLVKAEVGSAVSSLDVLRGSSWRSKAKKSVRVQHWLLCICQVQKNPSSWREEQLSYLEKPMKVVQREAQNLSCSSSQTWEKKNNNKKKGYNPSQVNSFRFWMHTDVCPN